MVFPSVPVYLDAHPPNNWQQQQEGATISRHQFSTMKMMMMPPSSTPPPPPPIGRGRSGGGGTGLVKAGSMAEQARLAKIPQQETALKCPRCESTNTKFCYFNNYSLTQPRHFCKTCRRYWTRGGALRNVPVGGGCRRNKRSTKRSSNSRSKSPPTTSGDHHHQPPPLTTSTPNNFPPPPQLPFFPPLDNLTSTTTSTNDFANADIGLNFYGIQPPPLASRSGSGNAGNEIHDFQIAGTQLLNLSARFDGDHWKLNHHQSLQQFPNFLSEGEVIHESALRNYVAALESNNNSSSSALDLEVQASHLKLQESSNNDNHHHHHHHHHHHQGAELSRHFSGSNDQYWSSAEINTWTDDLSAPSTNSTSTAAHLIM